ncbi:MAG: N-acetyltransferase [Flavobacteriaceae bacterium]|nr:MAG: N-acetyltransferase [Flavobacteriaceae bacterium]
MVFTEAIKYSDWEAVSRIYEEGIATGVATFEKEIPSWKEWDANHLKSCRIVARNKNEVLGWAALSPVSSRCVYGGVAEVSVYVAANARGLGVGKILMKRLIAESESEGFWTLQAGIFPENKNSIRLHEKSGFRIIGYRERIGQLDGVWKDNILLERRSSKIGL